MTKFQQNLAKIKRQAKVLKVHSEVAIDDMRTHYRNRRENTKEIIAAAETVKDSVKQLNASLRELEPGTQAAAKAARSINRSIKRMNNRNQAHIQKIKRLLAKFENE
ncbi:hypothetical protein [Limosilactobacillus difficilis]|uniref:hypothetical protein n=1 Tax=Limosilactobacillus difficilis TaxID=2991838 RepID=UPI0024BB028B|nr:hypothetical protein [Limosilactobacillus difficilis]